MAQLCEPKSRHFFVDATKWREINMSGGVDNRLSFILTEYAPFFK